jgi:hypothetical protein
MIKTTRAQRVALKQKWDQLRAADIWHDKRSYRQFRKSVHGSFDKSGCIMVQWCGMWVGIERDGYAHT